MKVALTKELERLVYEKVKSGRYVSATEVIREALRLLEEHDQVSETRLQDLRRDIQAGLASGEPLDGDGVFESLRVKNRARGPRRA